MRGHRRRRVGQDAGAHAPHRVPDRRAARVAVRPRRDHVHQQGRRRDEGARRRARRPGRAAHVGVDVPLDVLAHPAARGAGARLPVVVLDLRPGRRRPPRRLRAARPRHGPEALPAPAAARGDLGDEERAGVVGAGRRPGVHAAGEAGRRRVPRVPAAAARGVGARLRRPAGADGAPVPRPRRRPGAVEHALPPRAGRRVPGHQRRAVGARADAHRGAPQRDGGRDDQRDQSRSTGRIPSARPTSGNLAAQFEARSFPERARDRSCIGRRHYRRRTPSAIARRPAERRSIADTDAGHAVDSAREAPRRPTHNFGDGRRQLDLRAG